MLDKKQAGLKPEKVSGPRKQTGQVINLMDALKASISTIPKKASQSETSAGKRSTPRARKAS